MFKITAYGVRSNEVAYFNKLNTQHYELNLVEAMLNTENIIESKGSDGVLVRGNCLVDETAAAKFESWGIKYVFTRTVGFDHIDLQATKKHHIMVARVPSYSPYAVAELALTMGMSLFRHVNEAVEATVSGDLRVKPAYFSREVHSSTVGIVGAGRIGKAEAKLYAGMGAKVLAYDPYPDDSVRDYITFVDLPELLAQADIISVHVPYFKGENDNLINADFIKQMKNSAVLVNTARGELTDIDAVINGLNDGQLAGYGTDVMLDEKSVFGKQFDNITDIPNQADQQLLLNHPKVMVTPHIGSYTEPALEDMISISFANFKEALATGHSKFELTAK